MITDLGQVFDAVHIQVDPTHWVVTARRDVHGTLTKYRSGSLHSTFRYLAQGYTKAIEASVLFANKKGAHNQAVMARKSGLMAETRPCVLVQVADTF